jgi:hypothetical protein
MGPQYSGSVRMFHLFENLSLVEHTHTGEKMSKHSYSPLKARKATYKEFRSCTHGSHNRNL